MAAPAPSPGVIDLEPLLAAIPGGAPTGTDLRADSSPSSPYYAVKDARNKARAAERQQVAEGSADAAPADWKPVLKFATDALSKKTKDLEVVAYLIEALVRIHGFPGLRDGFRLARELVEKFWDNLYPAPDEEGLLTRVAPLTGLNGDDAEGTLLAPIARVPLTESGRLGLAHYQEALAFGKITDPKLREKKAATGATTPDALQKAVAETPPSYFARIVADLAACQDEFAKLGTVLEAKCGPQAPPTSQIRDALIACVDALKDAARAKLEVAAPAKAEEPGKDGAREATGAAGQAPPGEVLDVIRGREDAFRAMQKIADYFRRTEPHNPVSYALEMAVRWGRAPLPELLMELIPDEAPRKSLFKQVGIRPPEPAKPEKK